MSSQYRNDGGYATTKELRSRMRYDRDDEDYYPKKYERTYYISESRIVDYNDEAEDYRNNDLERERAIKADNEDSADQLYRRSKQRFASWDIRELGEGGTDSKRDEPGHRRAANGIRRSAEPWSEEDGEEEERNNRDEQLYRESVTIGSLKKKNERNAGLNLGFRALVDKFKSRAGRREIVDDEWKYKDRAAPKESKTERNQLIRERRREEPRSSPDGSKRRGSHSSPDDFEIRIQRYERARPEERSRSTSKDRAPKAKQPARVSERHSRPLTPPSRGSPSPPANGKGGFSMKEWYESNRQFAARYLRENGRAKEMATYDAKDEFVFGSPKEAKVVYQAARRGSAEETRASDIRRLAEMLDREELGGREDGGTSRAKSSATPSRKIWNYRDGGVHITDVEEGQPCLRCGETCSGFLPHIWRKNCTSCKCPREAHDVCHDEWVSVRARLGLKADDTREPVSFDPRDAGLAWAPPGLPLHKVEEYFSMLPEMSVPRLGTSGERHRDRQLATQLPKQDLARAYCRHLDPQHSESANDFMAARNEIALDIGSVQEVFDKAVSCGACSEPLKYGGLAVSASKLGQLYHPACFRCAQCEELLVDLAYCVHDDALYCERHYAEQLKPRCAACDELIFSGEYTKAMNKDWHTSHFCCWQCDESLTGQRYVLRDEHPYCIKCYESVFANGCEECHKIIGIDSKDLSYKDKHWHEACFLCNRCRVSLVDKQFGSKVDKIYCGNCYDAQFASRCDGCGEIFRAGTKKMEYKTRQWHEKCFCCVVCKNPIGTKSFIPREQEIYCAGCYEDKFATRCVKCSKIITSGGVTYKNEPWHRDCFTCTHCDQSLAGQRFTSRDEKPYCADCFGELFAKRCTACSKPITGIGGTRFISFEDRHWHNDCFICAGCQTSLVGRGFITDGNDIICPECAKQKLS